jgi:hypothetical protein
MEDNINAIVGCVILLILLGLLLSAIIPTDEAYAIVINKTWYTSVALKEDYTVTVCDTDFDTGMTTCDQEDRTRTLDRRSLSGAYPEPVVFPERFEIYSSDHHNDWGESYKVYFRLEESDDRHTQRISKNGYHNSYEIDGVYRVKLNVWDNIVWSGQ